LWRRWWRWWWRFIIGSDWGFPSSEQPRAPPPLKAQARHGRVCALPLRRRPPAHPNAANSNSRKGFTATNSCATSSFRRFRGCGKNFSARRSGAAGNLWGSRHPFGNQLEGCEQGALSTLRAQSQQEERGPRRQGRVQRWRSPRAPKAVAAHPLRCGRGGGAPGADPGGRLTLFEEATPSTRAKQPLCRPRPCCGWSWW
jgi:hypothetical protein